MAAVYRRSAWTSRTAGAARPFDIFAALKKEKRPPKAAKPQKKAISRDSALLHASRAEDDKWLRRRPAADAAGQPGSDPSFCEPSRLLMTALGSVSVIFRLGMDQQESRFLAWKTGFTPLLSCLGCDCAYYIFLPAPVPHGTPSPRRAQADRRPLDCPLDVPARVVVQERDPRHVRTRTEGLPERGAVVRAVRRVDLEGAEVLHERRGRDAVFGHGEGRRARVERVGHAVDRQAGDILDAGEKLALQEVLVGADGREAGAEAVAPRQRAAVGDAPEAVAQRRQVVHGGRRARQSFEGRRAQLPPR